jgi:hypothetical protein
MEREDKCRHRGPPILRREFARSRHEMDWAAEAYAIAVPVVRRGLGGAVGRGVEDRESAWTCTGTTGRPA